MDSLRPPHRHLSFGVYELDLHAGELRKHGVRLKLQQKPLALLAVLLEKAGEVVTREELRKRLWPEDTFVDFDHSVSIAVHKVRMVLSDTADNPRFIETLAGRGYRFLAPVRTPERSAPAGSGRVMVAVLPFDNLEGDPEQEYFVDGMTDELISKLASTNPQRLGVIARTSTMQYKKTERKLADIAKELGVQYVLEGSVRRTRLRARIHARLIEVRDQAQVWADTYDRPIKNVMVLQAEVASHIAKALAVELIPEREAKLAKASTTSLKAYELYLKGRQHWIRRTEAGFRLALECFQGAADLDPNYALAHVGIADCYGVFGFYGMLPPREAYEKAKSSALEALRLDDRLSEAHSALAFVTLQFDWDWPAAEKEHQTAIALNPNFAGAHHWYGIDLTQVGRFHDALLAFRQAETLDPMSRAVQAQLGWLFYFSRDFGLAAKQLRSVVEADGSFSLARYFLGMALTQTGEHAKAVKELQEAVRQTESHPACVAALVVALRAAGKKAEANKVMVHLERLMGVRHVSPYYMAFALAGSSRTEDAIRWLGKAFEEKSGWMLYLKIEPVFDAIRMEERVVELLRRVLTVQSGQVARAAHSA